MADSNPPLSSAKTGLSEQASAHAPRPQASWSLLILATVAVLGVLYVARDVIVPVVFAILLALLFRPLLRRMKAWQLPNALSAFILVGAVVGLFALGIWGLAGQAQRWLADAPNTIAKIKQMLPERLGPLGHLRQTGDAVKKLAEDEDAEETTATESTRKSTPSENASEEDAAPTMPMNSTDMALTALGVSTHFVAASVIVFVLAYFLLALSDDLLRQAVEAAPSFYEKRNVVQVVQNVEQGVSRYLATITVINIGLGIVTALAMWLMGLENYVLWGVMVTSLNYVPHVGATICMCVLFVVGTITHDSLWWGTAVLAVFIVITIAESYFITPLVLSRSLQLSPLAVILTILFWGWLWGVGGGLLAAPLLAVAKIVCDQFESLKPFAMIFSGETNAQHAQSQEAVAERKNAA